MYCQFQSIFLSRSAVVFDLLIFFNPIKFKGHKIAILTPLHFAGLFIKRSCKMRYKAILTHYSALYTSYSKNNPSRFVIRLTCSGAFILPSYQNVSYTSWVSR